jgi:hypothetical protein
MPTVSICNNIRKYKIFSFGSAAFTSSTRKMINRVEGSTERDSRKCKYSVLEVHIPRKSVRNIIK